MRELSDFDEMYQEVIIDHYKNPRNKAKLMFSQMKLCLIIHFVAMKLNFSYLLTME